MDDIMNEFGWILSTKDNGTFSSDASGWSELCENVAVVFGDKVRQVYLPKYECTKIEAGYKGMTTSLEVPEGHKPYFAIRAMTSFHPGGATETTNLGCVIGLVELVTGKVTKEMYLDGISNQVVGVIV